MTTISATVIADSLNIETGDRLTTIRARYPRCIHAEVMTHRAFSRNAASSRAIPVKRMIEAIEADPFVPLYWGKNQKGMSASEECDEKVAFSFGYLSREEAWMRACNQAIASAKLFDEAGYHKQLVNRLLEPFMHIEVLISCTNWSNFLALRDHPAAEPHIRILAQAIRKAVDESKPFRLEPGRWHLPYTNVSPKFPEITDDLPIPIEIKMSVARCAHLSYETVGTGDPIDSVQAERIFEQLLGSSPMHASPAEHAARAEIGQHGNFTGWRQLRKMLPGECL